MANFVLFAEPWWVNLLIVVPIVLFWLLRKYPTEFNWRALLIVGIFGIAFGFVEAAVVVYLRAAAGFLPGYQGTLSDVARLASGSYQQIDAARSIPKSLLTVEFFREIATIVMLLCVALICARRPIDRFAMFLWSFAFWDIFYYIGLWLTVRWPSSLTTNDVLFLIPAPWLSQVWFPILVSGLCIISVIGHIKRN